MAAIDFSADGSGGSKVREVPPEGFKLPRSYADFRDDVKQLVTLASGITGVTVALSRSAFEGASAGEVDLLQFAWLSMGVSLLFGIFALWRLTGIQYHQERGEHLDVTIASAVVRVPALLQSVLFLLGMALIVIFGVRVFD